METNREKKQNKSLLYISIIIFFILFFGFFSSIFLLKTGEKRRDDQRIRDLKMLKEALFVYYNENYNYPSSISDWDTERADFGADVKTGAIDYNNLASLLSKTLSVLPSDPLNEENTKSVSEKYLYRYVSSSNGQDFAIVFETEDPKDSSPAVIRGW